MAELVPLGHLVLEGVYESVVEHLGVAVKRLALVGLRATVRRWTGDCLALVLLGDEALPHGDAVATTLELEPKSLIFSPDISDKRSSP